MKKMTVKSRVMDFVKGMGDAKYTDIIKFIVEDVHGMEYNNKRHRGYYACAFSSYDPYFLHPSKNEPRCLKKDDVTKKYHVVGMNDSLKEIKEKKKVECKNLTDFYSYLKEAIIKSYGSFHTKDIHPDFTDLDVLIEGWNKYIDRPNAWTCTVKKIKGSEDPKSCQVKIWIGSPDGGNKGLILKEYENMGEAYIDEKNGHVIVRENAGMLFLELLMAVFGTEFLKNNINNLNLTWN